MSIEKKRKKEKYIGDNFLFFYVSIFMCAMIVKHTV